ncbi:MAG: GNAT family N-acetyltransferase [Bdellovibrionota bacterium]
MEGPRAPVDGEWSDLITFLNKSLRSESAWNIDEEYPTALVQSNKHNIRIIKGPGGIISHAVLKPLIVKSPHVIYKVGAIGSVVTDEKHRGQGHSGLILKNCVELAQEQQCDVAILWTNLYDHYRKFGFELAGSEVSFVVPPTYEKTGRPLQFTSNRAVAPDAILRVFNKHSVASVRTIDEVKKYLQIPQTKVYAAWELDGRLAAYAIMGKGVDLTGYAHEWGGDVEALLSLFSHIVREKNESCVVIIPGHSANLIRQMQNDGLLPHNGYLGMMKIVNFDQLAAKIKRGFRQLGIADFVLEKNAAGYVFGFPREIFTLQTLPDIQTLLFGPVNYRELGIFSEDSLSKLELLLPLPLWLWGWDSI